jgi:hypothetical protein
MPKRSSPIQKLLDYLERVLKKVNGEVGMSVNLKANLTPIEAIY